MARFTVALIGLSVAACVTAPTQWAREAEFILDVQDNPAQQRFDLVLNSTSSIALCLSRESWPGVEGLPAGFDGAILTTTSSEKALLTTGSAYCPGGCGHVRIEPGQSVPGLIPYSAFGDADVIAADDSRTLDFTVQPYICSQQR